MSVKFTGLVVEGFGSLQAQTVVDLSSKGIWLVKGKNGAGKTTMFSALVWAIYKMNLKGTKNDQVQTWEKYRRPEYQGTRVCILFENSSHKFMVARHIKYKATTKGLKGNDTLMIFRAGLDEQIQSEHLLGEEHYKGDMQEYINRLMGMDGKTFINSVVFGQRMARLVESDNKDKRQLFEKLFEVDFVAQAKAKADTKNAELATKISKLDSDIKLAETNKENAEAKYKREKQLVDQFEEDKKSDIAGKEGELRRVKKERDEEQARLDALKEYKNPLEVPDNVAELEKDLEEAETLLQEITNGKTQLEQSQSEYRVSIQGKENEIEKLKKSKVEEQCTHCGQDLKKEDITFVKDKLKKDIKSLTTTKTALDKKKKKIDTDLEAIEEERSDQAKVVEALQKQVKAATTGDSTHEIKHSEYKVVERSVGSHNRRVASVEDELKKIKDSKPPKVDFKAIEEQIAEYAGSITKMSGEADDLEAEQGRVQWWIKEGFAAKGIKAYVFNAMLSRLNQYVQKYASRLGVHVEFSIDLTKASKPFTTTCYKDGIRSDYAEFSGGEKQRIDIALAFAMHDLISDTSGTNLLVMDEVFEGLDAEGIEIVFDLIRVKAGTDKTVFVITHSSLIDSLNTKALKVEKDAETGISTIVQ